MKIERVKIGAHYYPVVQVTTAELDDTARWAEIDQRRHRIKVQTWERPNAAKAESLIHEILHGLLQDAGRPPGLWDEESVVEALSPRLAAFLVDNPDAVRELLRMLK